MRMRGEQSLGMHAKWGDGGDLGGSGVDNRILGKIDFLYQTEIQITCWPTHNTL